jgi:hypothetical protein
MRSVRSTFVPAVVFILAGTVLTLENLNIISGASRLWPVFLFVLGAGFFILFFERGRNDLALLFLGTVLVLLAAFFLSLNYTSWKNMATLWPFFLGIAGGGFVTMYLSSTDRLFLFLSLGLIMLGGLFFLVFGVSIHFWPLSLVAFGLSLLMVNYFYIRK